MVQKIIDAHVHGFPNNLFNAIWDYFEKNYWPIQQRFYLDEIAQYLPSQGVEAFTILNYAHKPNISGDLNNWSHTMGKKYPQIIPFGTIHPKDSHFRTEILRILSPAQLDLNGIKLQLMVTDFDPNEKGLDFMYEKLIQFDKILVLHAGTGPVTDMILNKQLELSKHVGIAKLIPVLERFPNLKIQIPHLGCMETNEFFDLATQYKRVYFDTSMALEFLFENTRFSKQVDLSLDRLINLQDKIMFGSDFPNISHPYSKPVLAVENLPIKQEIKDKIYYKNARIFYKIHSS
ncbi:MAG: amidohydrolase family protein [Promethearchaeota archaeon]